MQELNDMDLETVAGGKEPSRLLVVNANVRPTVR